MTMTGQSLNGTAGWSNLPVKSVVIPLDERGYPGWTITMRTNPRAMDYDNFISQEDERHWAGWKALVVEWNWKDDKGNPLPIPSEGKYTIKELPYDLQGYIVSEYLTAFNKAVALPNRQENASETTTKATT